MVYHPYSPYFRATLAPSGSCGTPEINVGNQSASWLVFCKNRSRGKSAVPWALSPLQHRSWYSRIRLLRRTQRPHGSQPLHLPRRHLQSLRRPMRQQRSPRQRQRHRLSRRRRLSRRPSSSQRRRRQPNPPRQHLRQRRVLTPQRQTQRRLPRRKRLPPLILHHRLNQLRLHRRRSRCCRLRSTPRSPTSSVRWRAQRSL